MTSLLLALLLQVASYTSVINGTPRIVLCNGSGLSLTTTGTVKQTLATCTIPANIMPTYTTIEVFVTGFHKTGNTNSITLDVSVAGGGGISRTSTVSAESIAAILKLKVGASRIAGYGQQMVGGGTTSGNIYGAAIAGVNYAVANDVTFSLTTGTAAGDATIDSYSVVLTQE